MVKGSKGVRKGAFVVGCLYIEVPMPNSLECMRIDPTIPRGKFLPDQYAGESLRKAAMGMPVIPKGQLPRPFPAVQLPIPAPMGACALG
jgi:hypothetical protein